MIQSLLNLEPDVLIRLQGFIFALVAMLLFERWLPARPRGYATRAISNVSLQLINMLLLIGIPLTLTAAALFALFNQFGLFNLIKLGLWTKIVLSWLVLDLIMYGLHRAYHGVGFLWRFHRVHHGDPVLDVTTTFRTHPVETLITLLVRAITVVLIGMPLLGVILYEIIVCTMALFIHANIRLHRSLDQIISWILVTPAMHRVHHGPDPVDYGANFGLVISIWDRVFGTFRAQPSSMSEDRIGIPGLVGRNGDGVLPMLKLPFK